jgi:hypothetical protein
MYATPAPTGPRRGPRSTLFLVDHDGGTVETCVTLCELKRALRASITELELCIVPKSKQSSPSVRLSRINDTGIGLASMREAKMQLPGERIRRLGKKRCS